MVEKEEKKKKKSKCLLLYKNTNETLKSVPNPSNDIVPVDLNLFLGVKLKQTKFLNKVISNLIYQQMFCQDEQGICMPTYFFT